MTNMPANVENLTCVKWIEKLMKTRKCPVCIDMKLLVSHIITANLTHTDTLQGNDAVIPNCPI